MDRDLGSSQDPFRYCKDRKSLTSDEITFPSLLLEAALLCIGVNPLASSDNEVEIRNGRATKLLSGGRKKPPGEWRWTEVSTRWVLGGSTQVFSAEISISQTGIQIVDRCRKKVDNEGYRKAQKVVRGPSEGESQTICLISSDHGAKRDVASSYAFHCPATTP